MSVKCNPNFGVVSSFTSRMIAAELTFSLTNGPTWAMVALYNQSDTLAARVRAAA